MAGEAGVEGYIEEVSLAGGRVWKEGERDWVDDDEVVVVIAFKCRDTNIWPCM